MTRTLLSAASPNQVIKINASHTSLDVVLLSLTLTLTLNRSPQHQQKAAAMLSAGSPHASFSSGLVENAAAAVISHTRKRCPLSAPPQSWTTAKRN
jgi:hypothetical protein